jgi:hypothetical protein
VRSRDFMRLRGTGAWVLRLQISVLLHGRERLDCMTWDQILRVIPVGSRNPWQTVDVLDDVLQHRAGLDEPIGFGDGRGAACTAARAVQSRPFLFLPVTPWSPLISSLGDAQA